MLILLSYPDYKGYSQAGVAVTIKSVVKGGAPYPDGAQHWGGITPAGGVCAMSTASGSARGCVSAGGDLREANVICRVDLQQRGECERKQAERSSPELAPRALVMGPLGPGRGRGRETAKGGEVSCGALLPSFLRV